MVNAQIKATCPYCGDVDLTTQDVVLHECSTGGLSYYTFDCTGCARSIRKPADTHVSTLLRTGGVRVEHWSIPDEAAEAHHGPVLSVDDLLDFVIELSKTEDLAAAARRVATS
ncbi:hypothetical protein GCM10009765_50020 [Fodinicola feengrottensis]|uniref:Restriction alleviation protein, Lar family n=1 Tax=Fodinicola feengrottensis TaxID=435914 RepID=A0ABP4TZ81_9ACTN